MLLPEQIALAEWMKESYHSLFVDALRIMIPAQMRGMRIKEKKVRTVALAEHIDPNAVIESLERAPAQKRVFELAAKVGAEVSVSDLNAFYPGCTSAVDALICKGYLVQEPAPDTTTLRSSIVRMHKAAYWK